VMQLLGYPPQCMGTEATAGFCILTNPLAYLWRKNIITWISPPCVIKPKADAHNFEHDVPNGPSSAHFVCSQKNRNSASQS
jgi:hypothetical protein